MRRRGSRQRPRKRGYRMPVNLELSALLDYTDWERQGWQAWFRHNGDQPLKISSGPHGDGRFETAGDVVRHIFSSEKRYVDRLAGRPLTETGSLASDSAEALFRFGRESRRDLREFFQVIPERQWDLLQDFTIMDRSLKLTPRKIVLHVLLHEIRHWAQIATLFRLHGWKVELHDFLFSPVLADAAGQEKSAAERTPRLGLETGRPKKKEG